MKSLCPQGACRNAGVCALLTFGRPTGRRAARESAFVPRNDTRESNSEEVFGPRKLATFCACFPSVTRLRMGVPRDVRAEEGGLKRSANLLERKRPNNDHEPTYLLCEARRNLLQCKLLKRSLEFKGLPGVA